MRTRWRPATVKDLAEPELRALIDLSRAQPEETSPAAPPDSSTSQHEPSRFPDGQNMTALQIARWAIDFSREWPRDRAITDEQLAEALETAERGLDPVSAADVFWDRAYGEEPGSDETKR